MKTNEVELLARISTKKEQKTTCGRTIMEYKINTTYVCEYCNTGYSHIDLLKTLAVHMCEKKRRHLQKNEKRVTLGFYA